MGRAFGRMQTTNLWWCLFFALAIMSCNARPSFFPYSGKDSTVARTEGRSLAATVDYSDPSANHGHDPKNRGVVSGGGSKKNHGSPDFP